MTIASFEAGKLIAGGAAFLVYIISMIEYTPKDANKMIDLKSPLESK